ncbi:MAG: trypsin-like peptidase domain-containing protein [Vicinamibacterales bacterium]|nr:trypsin-like peptidase domain-containing protein [Vicinamibacterales bacterium]
MGELPLQPGEPWVCASCGRKVPGRIAQCRCGALAPSPTLALDEGPAEMPETAAEAMATPAMPSRLWWWGAPGLVGLGLLIGLWVARPAELPPSSPPALEAPLADHLADEDEDGAVAIEDEVIIGESATTDTTVVPLPAAEPLVLSGETPRAVEDLVAGAIDAVVMVEAGQSRGTGFFVAPTLAITTAHVVGQHASVTLRLEGGATMAARVERLSTETDLALLRVPSPRPASAVLPLGSSRGLRAGQEVIVIGSPLGLRNTVTRGIVSALRNASGVLLVQTDAAINPGNSGGPLLDRQGRVIGVATLKQGDAESLGFAVAIDHVQALIDGRPLDASWDPRRPPAR